MVVMSVMVYSTNNGAWDVSAKSNIFEVPSDPKSSSIIVSGNILLLNRTYLLYYRCSNCMCFCLGCESKHHPQSNEKRKNKLHNEPSKSYLSLLDGQKQSLFIFSINIIKFFCVNLFLLKLQDNFFFHNLQDTVSELIVCQFIHPSCRLKLLD